jgi:DNA-binding IclR family transcriptional regulator
MRPDHLRDDTETSARRAFLEMPRLRLTTAQAQRLWDLDRAGCEMLLGRLVDTGFLRCAPDGSYVLRADAALSATPIASGLPAGSAARRQAS